MAKTDQRKSSGLVSDRSRFLDKSFIQKALMALLFGTSVGGAGLSLPFFSQPVFTEKEKIELFTKIDLIKLNQEAILFKFQSVTQDLKYHKEGNHITFKEMTKNFVLLTPYENEVLRLYDRIDDIK